MLDRIIYNTINIYIETNIFIAAECKVLLGKHLTAVEFILYFYFATVATVFVA